MDDYNKKIIEESHTSENETEPEHVERHGGAAEFALRREAAKRGIKAVKTVRLVLGVLESLFAIRLVLKLLGANPASGFVQFIYAFTQLFLFPFTSIFGVYSTNGIETKAVLEPANVTGMIVYALIAWCIIKFIEIHRVRD